MHGEDLGILGAYAVAAIVGTASGVALLEIVRGCGRAVGHFREARRLARGAVRA